MLLEKYLESWLKSSAFLDDDLPSFWPIEAEKIGTWYHYTTVEALLSMVQGDQIILWASHNEYVNDKLEIKAGAKFVSQYMEEIDKSIKSDESWKELLEREEYIACFSRAKDCIPMWNTNAHDGNGLAIGFDPYEIENAVSVIYSDSVEELSDWKSKLKEILVGKRQNKNLARFLLLISYMPLLYKDKSFSYEQEVRLVASSDAKVKFRSKNGMILPYKEIVLPTKCVKEIIIGPTANFEKQKKGLEMFLSVNGIKNVSILQSQVPLQN